MLAFVHIEKCGGTTLIDVLRHNFFLDHVDVIPRDPAAMLYSPDDLREIRRFRPSAISIAGHSVRTFGRLDDTGIPLAYYTCLRDPVKRYISDYLHFVELLGHPVDIDAFLERPDRQNFQTKSIAGSPDLGLAKSLLRDRFAVVGVLEHFDEFLSNLGSVIQDHTGITASIDYQIKNTRSDRTAKSDARLQAEAAIDQIVEVNQLDIALHQYVLNEVAEHSRFRTTAVTSAETYQPSTISRLLPRRAQDGLYRVYRNLIYKPYMGHWPTEHRLPVYREQLQESRSKAA